ncbi:MAG TPA: tetratricopeptide repeat protein [Sphingobium sp.]
MILALLLAAAAPVDAPASTRSLYLQLIHQARADGRPRAALAYLDDFDRRYPGDPDARALRVNSLLDLGDVDGAESAAANLHDNAMRGHLLAARNRWSEAVPLYRAAIAASPADPLLRNALGYALLRAGKADQAIEPLRAAIDLAPADRVIRNNLLLALTIAGHGAEAEAMLRHVPEQASLRRQLAAQASQLQKAP